MIKIPAVQQAIKGASKAAGQKIMKGLDALEGLVKSGGGAASAEEQAAIREGLDELGKLAKKHPELQGTLDELVDAASKVNGPKGGTYGQVRSRTKGGEVHHIPAAKVTPYAYRKAPATWMEKADHKATTSWGPGKAAQAYRQRQAELIAQGKLREAMQMDIDDIRSKFGSKYDEHIKEMLKAFGFSE